MMSLQEKYRAEVIPAMRARFSYGNVMAVPKIVKVSVNTGVGRMRDEKDRAEVQKYLSLITGQKAGSRAAKKAIASFKTRKGLVIGYHVTLRGKMMYDFLTRLIAIALPRTRDFKGISQTSFDERGNLTIGIKEHIVFPEIIGEDYRFLFGLEVSIVTNAVRREEGMALLELMGFPIISASGDASTRRIKL